MINLPHHKSTVIRVSPEATLADIFRQVVADKQLDPYTCEVRHPSQADVALNMASPLREYGLSEIDIVDIGAGKSRP